ncbi:hypothetical protein QVD17_30596 [Tagetes erecta]|uniref:Uncharacterized protein n=1 Tax=Tagetes erecta TaxID=13708 RepID=A0AAD8K5X5_TARER|nr:hypothetical protein QVD17_30596 [Tagetes erecta]
MFRVAGSGDAGPKNVGAFFAEKLKTKVESKAIKISISVIIITASWKHFVISAVWAAQKTFEIRIVAAIFCAV